MATDPMQSQSHAFLDCEPLIDGIKESSKPRRPWQSYWPPAPGCDLYNWLNTEYPQILAWKFDPNSPFDRPWQLWTKQPPKSQQPTLDLGEIMRCPPPKTSEVILPPESADKTPAPQDKQHDPGLPLPQIQPKGFSYLAPLPRFDVEKPYHTRLPFLNGLPRTNIAEQAYPVTISNINGFENHFKLETAGFQYINNPVQMKEWTAESVRSSYIPFVEKWLLQYFGCEKVYVYTYTFRCKEGRRDDIQWTNPFTRVHCDITPNSSISRLRLHLPNEADQIQQGRYRYINVWRPINCTEQDHSLALCDARTMANEDLVPTDVLFPHYCDESFEVKYNPQHRWYYKKGMSPDETVVFKLYDTKDGEAKFCAHSAFVDHTVSAGIPKRESIEVRAILIG